MTASSLRGQPPTSSLRLIAVLLLLCVVAASGLDCSPGSTCFSAQQTALAGFYNALGGPTWRLNTNWLSSTIPGQHCAWAGVYCCAGCSALSSGSFLQTYCSTPCSVIGLDLPNHNLVGELAGIDATTVWQQLNTMEFIDIQGMQTHLALLGAFCPL